MYLVATRIRRLCCARKPVVTSSRSAMVRTSIQACGGAAIVARTARLGERKPGAGEEGLGVFLQPALGGDGENEGRGHDALPRALPICVSVSTQTENPTAGIGVAAPSW